MNQILPTGLTPENLAKWLEDNHKDHVYAVERHEYTDEELDKMAYNAMGIGKEILALKEVMSNAKEGLEKGTMEDYTVIIPVSKGIKKLEAQRDSIYENARRGYWEEKTKLYGIPDSLEMTMRFFDIEGNEHADRGRRLKDMEIEKFGSPLFNAAKDFHEGLASNGMKVTGVADNTVTIEVSEQKELDFSDPINEEKVDEDGVSEVDFEEEKDILTFDGERVSAEKSEPEKHSSDDDEINDMEFKI